MTNPSSVLSCADRGSRIEVEGANEHALAFGAVTGQGQSPHHVDRDVQIQYRLEPAHIGAQRQHRLIGVLWQASEIPSAKTTFQLQGQGIMKLIPSGALQRSFSRIARLPFP